MVIAATPATAMPRLELRALEARVLFHGHPANLARDDGWLLKTLLEGLGPVLSRTQFMSPPWSWRARFMGIRRSKVGSCL